MPTYRMGGVLAGLLCLRSETACGSGAAHTRHANPRSRQEASPSISSSCHWARSRGTGNDWPEAGEPAIPWQGVA